MTFLATTFFLLIGGAQIRQDLPASRNRDAKYWQWTKWEWKPDPATVTGPLQRVDALVTKGKGSLNDIVQIAVQFREQFVKAPKPDAKTLVVWAYASRGASLIDQSSNKITRIDSARLSLDTVAPIPSYAYARTRFLLINDYDKDKYIPLGERLLKRNTRDYAVKYELVYLVYTRDVARAKILNSELLRDHPTKIGIIAQRGDVFKLAYRRTKNKADLLEAKRSYELYLLKAPASDSYAPVVRMRLKSVKKALEGLKT